jgi:hypothetical protein
VKGAFSGSLGPNAILGLHEPRRVKEPGQFCDAVAFGEFVKALIRPALRQIALEDSFDAFRHLIGGDRAVNLAAEFELGAAAAADEDVIALDLFVLAFLDLSREQTDIADIVLGAGIGAPGQMNVDGLIELNPAIEMIDQR